MAKPFITVNLDRPRNLRFNTNAIAALEETLGRSINNIMSEQSDIGMRELRAIIWAGLQHEKKETGRAPSLEDVGDIIDEMMDQGRNMQDIGMQIGNALGNSMNGGKVGEPGNP